LRNSNGFSLIEVLVAFSIIFMITTTIIPLISLLNQGEEILSQRMHHTNSLHDELQTFLWGESKRLPPVRYSKTEDSVTASYQFTTENNLIKGCVEWENVKKKKEKFCLYGYPPE
jgi:Tfp pilus assembly protein PilV